MTVFILCFCLCTIDAVLEEIQELETTVAESEPEEPSTNLHCDEDLDDNKSTEILLDA